MAPTGPLLIAHRGGNDLAALRDAETLGADLVEADVHLFTPSERVDIRHGRRLGRLPILRDEWRIARPGAALTLERLLDEAAPGTALLLDLKGRDIRLAERVADLLAPILGRRTLWVCARRWELLRPFQGEPRVRALHSVGTRRELDAFLARSSREAGLSVRESLLSAPLVPRLRALADVLVSWTVNQPDRAVELARWGVDGLTTDDLSLLDAVVVPAPVPALEAA